MNHESRPVKSNPESYRNLGLKIGRTKVINILKLNLSTFRILKHHHKKMRAEHDLSATMLKNVKNKYQWHFYALFVQCKPGSHMLKAKKPSVIQIEIGEEGDNRKRKNRRKNKSSFLFYSKKKSCLKNQLTGEPQFSLKISKPAIACSKLAIETIEQGVKYVQI